MNSNNTKCDGALQDRPYQMRLIDEIVNDWMGNNKHKSKIMSSLIEMAPGAGKTVMAFRLAKIFKQRASEIVGLDSNDIGIGWVAGRRNLLKQAQCENKRLVNCEDVFFISQFSNDLKKCGIHDFKYKFLVIDEAHHEACSTMHNIINLIDPGHMLGLSATPIRTDKARLCFQKNYKTAGFYTLIDEGWLSDFDHWNIPDWTPNGVVARYLSDPSFWGKSIMYFRKYEECLKVVSDLKNAGVKVDLITGQTNREEQLNAFENDDLNVLVNMFVLTEGFDFPRLKTVWVRDSGRLPTIQMCGRVLRPHEDIPVVNIVQSMNTKWPFTRTANIAKRQMVWRDDYWERIDCNEVIDQTVRNTIDRLMKSSLEDNDDDTLKQLRMMRNKRRHR